MGKSGAKWIKNIFALKKTSKSGLSKEAGEKETLIRKGSTEVLEERSPVLSDGLPLSQNRSGENQELQKGNGANMQKDAAFSLAGDENIGTNGLNVQSSVEKEKAAAKVQATYRGYLARRAFRVLKGIIRLQALVRGHLVRRQAIATLHRMQGIVKLQRLIRGQRGAVKPSQIYIIFRPGKLHKNSFIYKLLDSSTTAIPLSIQYDQSEPNSAVMWLRRWSLTQFWAPPPHTKKAHGTGFKKQQNGIHSGETEPSRSKRTRKVPSAENNSSNATSDLEKPNRNQRKTNGHKLDSMQELPQSELERVKRNLRKVSASSKEVLESSESIPALPKSVVAEPTTQYSDNSDKVLEDSSIVLKKEDAPEMLDVQKITISEDLVPKADASPEGPASGETNGLLDDECPKIEPNPSMHEENGDDITAVKEEPTPKEESAGKISHKSKRRMSFPAKQEYPENVSVNTPSPGLPSYMAATESAKAKLKGQGSARFSQEAVENGSIRRHSLPSSNSGRLSSMSPRVQRQVQVNGKGASKTDRPLLASRDSNEKPGWRR